jgi:hypothetical protein
MIKRYQIYAKNECVYEDLSETEFNEIWGTMEKMLEFYPSKKFNKNDFSYTFRVISH